MKKLLLILFVGITLCQAGVAQVIIARNCDPKNNYSPDRFSEIYNVGNTTVDLTGWTLENIQGGKIKFSWSLFGTINPGQTKICGKANATGQTITPDFTAIWSGASWNGKGGDGTILKDNNGTVIDYAVQDDATATFGDKEMKRKLTVVSPTAIYDVNQWVFSTVNNANDIIPGFHGTVWRKTTSHTIWGTSSNWDGETPTATADAYIPGGVSPHVNNAVSSPAECNNLTIASGGTLTVPVNKALTVNGDLSIDAAATPGTLVVASDAAGNGSLIVNGTVSGSVTVERYVGKYTSGTGTGNGWHEIGCPVASIDPNGTNWDPNGTNNDLYAWSESDNKWVNYRTTPFTFSAGNGYLMANNTNLTHEFTGILNTGDVAVSGLTYTSGKGNGWHLLGNPFSSAIRWNDGNWTLTNVGTTAEIYDEESGNYFALRYNTTDYIDTIPSTDGFFVQVANGTTGSVTIPSASRFHCRTKNNYKSEKKEELKETLIFEVTNDANSYYDVNMMGFKPEATKDWDIAFDAHKLFGNAKAPQLWTVSKDQKFQVNYLPEVTTVYDIPLDFRAGVNTVYHLTIKGADSFENTSLVLEDLQTGEKIDLSNENSYDFSATKDDDVNRFVLHINGVTGVPTLNETDGIQIFAYGKTVCLHTSEQKSLEGKVSVFNMLGQVVYSGTLNGTNRQQFRLDQQTGIYFVRLEENNNVVTRKVVIK